MSKFIFIAGAVAAGKSSFMKSKLYNEDGYECNFFDHDQAMLMIQLYAQDKSKVNNLTLASALQSAINDSIENNKDFLMEIHYTNEQSIQINTYLHQYKNQFEFDAHFIAISEVEILKVRAKRLELLGGNSFEGKLIEKSFSESFKNFVSYLPKLSTVTIWDNSTEFGLKIMQEQLVFENGKLSFKNDSLTAYSEKMLNNISESLRLE